MTARGPESGFEVLVVCTANICRSPYAGLVLARAVSSIAPGLVTVSSAGVSARTGALACRSGLAPADGEALAAHRARRLDAGALADADLVLVADRGHAVVASTVAPGVRSRLFTLRQAAACAEVVRAALEGGSLPQGAPPLPPPTAPADRLRWWREELDAARGLAPRDPTDPDEGDIPDPHERGDVWHPQARDLIDGAVAALAASAAAVLAHPGPPPRRV